MEISGASGGAGGRALTFGSDGTLYEGGDSGFYTWDLGTGLTTLVADYTHVGFPAFNTGGGDVVSLATRSDGEIYCLIEDHNSSDMGQIFLATIDPATAVVTNIAQMSELVEGIAFVPAGIF